MSSNPAQRHGAASHGSLTLTASEAGPATLRLRAEPEERRRIQWAEDVVDNEGMGRKSSKVCCIYHKPREAGESSSDESSSDDSSSSSSDDADSEPDNSRARPANRNRHNPPDHPCHDHDHGHDHAHASRPGSDPAMGRGKQKARRPSPNAYERLPKRKDPKKH